MANNLRENLGLSGNVFEKFGQNVSKRISDYKNESLVKSGAIGGTRFLEGLLGVPGSVVNLGADILNALGGGLSSLTESIPYAGPYIKKTREFLGGEGPAVEKTTITPKGLRERITKPIFGEYIKPKKGLDKAIAGIAEDAGSFLGWGMLGGIGGTAVGLGTALASGVKTAAFGGTAKEGAKMLGFSKPTQEIIKTIAMIGSNVKGGGAKLKETVENSYDALRAATPARKFVDINKYIKKTVGKIKDVTRYGFEKNEPAKKYLINKLSEIKRMTNKSGKMNLRDLIQSQKDLRAATYNKEFIGIKNLVKGLSANMKDAVKGYAAENPEWGKLKDSAESIYGASMARSVIHDNLINFKDKRHFSFKNPLTWILTGMATNPAIIKAGAGLYGVGFLEKGLKQILKDKRVMKIYAGLIPGALEKSAAGIASSISRLDKAISRSAGPFKLPPGFTAEVMDKKKTKETGNKVNGFELPPGFTVVN